MDRTSSAKQPSVEQSPSHIGRWGVHMCLTLASEYPHALLVGSYHGCLGELAVRLGTHPPGAHPPGSRAQVGTLAPLCLLAQLLLFLLPADFCGWARRCLPSCLLSSGCSGFLGSVGLGGPPALVQSRVLWKLRLISNVLYVSGWLTYGQLILYVTKTRKSFSSYSLHPRSWQVLS